MTVKKTVLKGKEWFNYLKKNKMTDKSYMELYNCTHNYTQIYKIDDYYFCMRINRGYLNRASLKRLV